MTARLLMVILIPPPRSRRNRHLRRIRRRHRAHPRRAIRHGHRLASFEYYASPRSRRRSARLAERRRLPALDQRLGRPRLHHARALISGENLDNVAITGRGTIDGRGQMWWEMMRQLESSMKIIRPRLIRLVDCRNVLVEGVTLTNSPAWTLNPLACDNVSIRGLTVINPPDSPNTDGINPDSCRNVRISDCHIDVGDDCVTIKSGSEDQPRREYRACENIVVTNCTMMHGHGGVVIGSEMSGGVRNVAISNCTFVGTDRGIRIKSRRGRGGVVEDIRVSNIVMDRVLCPLAINLFYGCGAWDDPKVLDKSPKPVDETTPRFRRLRFQQHHCTASEVLRVLRTGAAGDVR